MKYNDGAINLPSGADINYSCLEEIKKASNLFKVEFDDRSDAHWVIIFGTIPRNGMVFFYD